MLKSDTQVWLHGIWKRGEIIYFSFSLNETNAVWFTLKCASPSLLPLLLWLDYHIRHTLVTCKKGSETANLISKYDGAQKATLLKYDLYTFNSSVKFNFALKLHWNTNVEILKNILVTFDPWCQNLNSQSWQINSSLGSKQTRSFSSSDGCHWGCRHAGSLPALWFSDAGPQSPCSSPPGRIAASDDTHAQLIHTHTH